jgi:hypothetical protein
MHFVSIAQAHQIDDVKSLAQFLHDNGIILWFNYVCIGRRKEERRGKEREGQVEGGGKE